VKSVRGTKGQNYRDGVLQRSRVATERLVRTSTNHVSNASREEFFRQNKNVVKAMQWVATLDTRTCPRCRAMDGKQFPVTGKKKGKRPPLHINCRCTLTPVTKSWKEMGLNIEEFEPGVRASVDGEVSATETYDSWLRKQSAEVQDEALGKTRGALYRRGNLSVDRFVDLKGNQITLEELRKREAGAFRKAGV
jgi:SPP1 gp7 family putative phage head morphogenesis protein